VWLLYGIQPKGARHSMTPGHCKGKAHQPEHLGIAGRRVLVSRKWSNKILNVPLCSTSTRIAQRGYPQSGAISRTVGEPRRVPARGTLACRLIRRRVTRTAVSLPLDVLFRDLR
jgi:replication initiator protein RepSA